MGNGRDFMVERRQQWVFAENDFTQHLHSRPGEGSMHEVSRSADAPDLLRAVRCNADIKEVLQDLTKLNIRHNVGIGASMWINVG